MIISIARRADYAGDHDQLFGKVEVLRIRLCAGISDEQPLRIDARIGRFDFTIELADGAKIDVERFDRVLCAQRVVVGVVRDARKERVVFAGAILGQHAVVGHFVAHQPLDQRHRKRFE
jgi:hypothetical protein